ncbi:hypothetical protein ACOME3_008341 [Neoechinorhynchus agilis]
MIELKFKKSEDPDVVADRFIFENNIDPSFKSQIVDFVRAQLRDESENVIPSSAYIGYTSIASSKVIERIRSNNERSGLKELCADELDSIENDLNTICNSEEWMPNVINKIVDRLILICEQYPPDNMYPFMDIIRYILVRASFDVHYSKRFHELKSQNSANNILNGIVFLRIISNLFVTTDGQDVFKANSRSVVDAALDIYQKWPDDVRIIKGFSSMFHNYCLFHYKTGNGGEYLKSFAEQVDTDHVKKWPIESIDVFLKGYATALIAPVGSINLNRAKLVSLNSWLVQKEDWTSISELDEKQLANLKKTCRAVKSKIS